MQKGITIGEHIFLCFPVSHEVYTNKIIIMHTTYVRNG